MYQNKDRMLDGLSIKYGVDQLAYYEIYEDSVSEMAREKKLLKWSKNRSFAWYEDKNLLRKDLCNEIRL